jgi:hypothetical protein
VAVLPLFVLTLFLPLIVISMVWRRPRRPLAGWMATLILGLGVVGFSFFVAPWGTFGLALRYGLGMLFALAVVMSVRRPVPVEERAETPLRAIVKVLMGLLFGSVAIGAIAARAVPPSPIELGFPLRGGAFLVNHGGSSSAANMHNVDPVKRYAVDLVKLNAAGMRARGLFPGNLSSYAVFGAQVVSPCDGTVRLAVDAFPDQPPGGADPKHEAGNYIVLRCGDADIVLAHLRRASVRVHTGGTVRRGELLALVGNSGLSGEPHLRIHAERKGIAVPARFDGQWLVRNDVVRR